MMPNDPQDVDVYEKSKDITISFINELFKNEFLKKYVTIEEDVLHEKIMDRINYSNETLSKLEEIITSKKFEILKKNVSDVGIVETDIMHMYQSLFITSILSAYEFFKKYLLSTLDKTTLGLNGRESLGSILNKLEKKKIRHGFDVYLDKGLRNGIGHDWYWFDSNNFNYIIDPDLKRTKSLSIGELMIKKRQIELFTKSFIDHAYDQIYFLINRR